MATRKRRKRVIDSSEVKNWVMFIFALILLWGMFRRGDDLNAWWTLIIGAMLSLTSLMVAVENITTVLKRDTNGPNGPNGSNGRNGKKDNDGEPSTDRVPQDGEEAPPDPSVRRMGSRHWKPGRRHQSEVAGGWDVDLPSVGGLYPGTVQ